MRKLEKLATRQDEDYSIGCLLDYGYVKNHYTLISFDLSKQKEQDSDPKAI